MGYTDIDRTLASQVDLDQTLVVKQKSKNLELPEESGFKIFDHPVSVISKSESFVSQTIVADTLHLDSFALASPEKSRLNIKTKIKYKEPIPPLPNPNTFRLQRLTDVENKTKLDASDE